MAGTTENRVKLKTAASQGHGRRGGVKVGPYLPSSTAAKFEEILETLMNHAVSFETKQHVLNRAVSQCPSITIDILGQKIPSLLDSGSMVTLICEGYFTKNILAILKRSAGDLTEAHSSFQLLAANNEVMPVSKYFEADVTLLGFTIPHVGFLVVKDPNTLLEPQHSTQLPGVIRCNLICLGCEEFGKVYGFEAFGEFRCPPNLHLVVFAQVCSFYHQGKLSEQPQTLSVNQIHSGQININTSELSSEVRNQDLSQESVLSQVWVGNPQQAICILANSMKVVQGRTNRITRWLSCMVEARACNNLPRGVVVNRTMFTPNKNKRVPVSLVNTNTYNVWICQTLLAADIVEAEDCPWTISPSCPVMAVTSKSLSALCLHLKCRQKFYLKVLVTWNLIQQINMKKARGQNLGLNPTSKTRTLTSNRN